MLKNFIMRQGNFFSVFRALFWLYFFSMEKQQMLEVLVPRVLARAKELGLSAEKVSKAAGQDRGYVLQLRRALEGKRTPFQPKDAALRGLAAALDCSVDWLLGRTDEIDGSPEYAEPDHTKPGSVVAMGDEFAAVPRWDIKAGAGEGYDIPPEPEALHRLLFRMAWLRSVTDAPLSELVALQVAGSSMEPTLMPGDLVLADRTRTRRDDDSIYVVEDAGEVKIKRVLLDHATGSLILRSDNPAVKDLPPAPPDSRRIVGRVFWVGRNL